MKKIKATTLIEIIIYFAVFAVFIVAALSFAIQIINISELSSQKHELATQAEFIEEKVRIAIQGATSINAGSSTFDSNNGVLSLSMTDASVSPTVFSLSSGNLLMKEGNAAAKALNDTAIVVTSLRFHKISYSKTPDQVQVDIDLSTPSELANTDDALSLHFTISLRP